METLKTLIQSKFKTLVLILMTLTFSTIALMVRMKLNKSFFFLFLIWNVFLAIVPFAITMYLNTKQGINRLKLELCFLVWLAFLPNAPYIVTDLIHLKASNYHMMWLDILVVLSFALSGLLLFYLSIFDLQCILKNRFDNFPIQSATVLIIFLCGFGVYLGRFLRYNSWEIITHPNILLSDSIEILISPFQNFEAWFLLLDSVDFYLLDMFFLKIILKSINRIENF